MGELSHKNGREARHSWRRSLCAKAMLHSVTSSVADETNLVRQFCDAMKSV